MRLGAVLRGLQEILCVCPCCGEIFRLSEARLYYGRLPRPSWFDELREETERLELAESRLQEELERLRERAGAQAERKVRRELRSRDKLFTPLGYYPKDARALLDPVDYVVFDGLSTGERVRSVVLLDLPARDAERERVQQSIERVVERGYVEWRELRVRDDGSVSG
jgi:predicted Holliday junction resolvase-like endonuclease